MKFKEGSRVEVSRRDVEPYGSWFPAKVLSFGGCKYTVMFKRLVTAEGKPAVEKVPEEDVRPRPPLVRGEERWVVGDIAEVLDAHLWKVGKVVKVLRENYFVVKLFGTIQLKEFHISSLRVRQEWHNNEWIIIGKVSGSKQSSNCLIPAKANAAFTLRCNAQDKCKKYQNDSFGALSPSRTTKENVKFRVNKFPSDAVARTGKKRIGSSKLRGCPRIAKKAPPGKVDVDSFPKCLVQEKCMHENIKGRMLKSSEMDVEKVKASNHTKHPFSRPLPITGDDDECSVASCSVKSLAEYSAEDSREPLKEIAGSFFDGHASTYPTKSARKSSHVSRENIAADVHELELHAYQSTVQALYASGPLSWEQESLLTNLRLSLHISNDEHLLQLRNLLSS